MSYHQSYFQIEKKKKNREKTIDERHCTELYKYIWGIITANNCKLYRINGVEDHIHIFSDIHPSLSISDFVKKVKVPSSIWMKESGKFPMFKGWQDGYAAFSYSVNDKDRIINYIKNQKEHHKSETFQDEFRRLLVEHNIEFDEKYLL
jgi:REP element-mobilizing transposase RayT